MHKAYGLCEVISLRIHQRIVLYLLLNDIAPQVRSSEEYNRWLSLCGMSNRSLGNFFFYLVVFTEGQCVCVQWSGGGYRHIYLCNINGQWGENGSGGYFWHYNTSYFDSKYSCLLLQCFIVQCMTVKEMFNNLCNSLFLQLNIAVSPWMHFIYIYISWIYTQVHFAIILSVGLLF